MTQTARREWLIKYLLNEPDSPDKYKNIEIPPHEDESAQKDLLRSLMNVRPPRPVSEEFLEIQDEYLKEQQRARNHRCCHAEKFSVGQKAFFVAGRHHNAECGRNRERRKFRAARMLCPAPRVHRQLYPHIRRNTASPCVQRDNAKTGRA